MVLPFDGATSTAPITSASLTLSNIGHQVAPALVVFHTPPAGMPTKNVPGSPMTPETAEMRPPRNGPTLRQTSAASKSGLIGVAATEMAATVTAAMVRKTACFLFMMVLMEGSGWTNMGVMSPFIHSQPTFRTHDNPAW